MKANTAPLLPPRPIFMVVDGHSIVYRAYYALAPRVPLNVRTTGEPIGAVFGFVNMFLKAWADVKPAYWAIAFDRAAPTFRDHMYADYKAGRTAAPDELSSQFGRVREVVKSLGIPIVEMDGYEADDIIGTLSRTATEKEMDTVILTGDTDALQLVSPHVTVRLQSRIGDITVYDVAKLRDKYGLEPNQFIDYKALKGDSSDNIHGVPGIGEVKATRLLQKHGSIDGIYAHIEEVEPIKERKVLAEFEARVRENRNLVAIDRDVFVQHDFEQGRTDRFDRPLAVELFRKLEFNTLINRLPYATPPAEPFGSESKPEAGQSPRRAIAIQTVDSLEDLDALVRELQAAGRFALDVQSNNHLAMSGDLVGLAVSAAPGKAAYVPLGHMAGRQAEKRAALEILKPVLEDPKVEKIAHNGKFDTLVLASEGVQLQGLRADVIIAAYVLGANALTIKAQAFERLGVEIPALSDLTGTGKKAITVGQAPIPKVAELAGSRAELTLILWPIYEAELKKASQEKLFFEMEMPLLPVLARMERQGIAIDSEVLHAMSRAMNDRLMEIEKAAYDSVGHMFNIASPQQLGVLLFEELGLPKTKRTKQGYSTDAQVLEGLRAAHPVIEHILEYRQVSKLKSTYVDALPELVNPRTGRLHTTLSQTVAATGRLSSSEPNLQNIPIRTDMGRRIREAFIAKKNLSLNPSPEKGGTSLEWTLLSADYSQIELRVLAHMSQDPGLLEAFKQDQDIHRATASQVFNVPPDQVTPDMRRFAKVVNFGLVYGMGEFGLATRSDRTREEAAPIIQEYFRKYPGILHYLEDTKTMAREKGYVQTLLGRRRYVPEIRAGNFQVRSAAERMAVNMPIQGTAADIIKIAMINLDRRMREKGLRSQMLLQVHDELIFEVPQEELQTMKDLILEWMPRAMDLAVPLKVDLKQGATWGAME